MSFKLKRLFVSLLNVEPHERVKLLLLSICYFCIIAGYTIAKELKDSVFATVVGSEYIPIARMSAMIILIPAILFYSVLVDRLRRYQLLCFYTILYGCVSLIFAFLLGHPIIGISNTDSSPYRLFGWLFYFFLEGYTPFIVSVFWAFANSITDQEAAKKNYGLMVSGSKLGGMVSAGASLIFLCWYGQASNSCFSDTLNHQILLVISSVTLFVIPVLIIILMNKVPGRYLHGYEAVYRVEKEREKKGQSKTGIFSGLAMMIKYPYVLGMFSIIFFYEIINTVLSYNRVLIAQSNTVSISEMTIFLYKIVFLVHFFGFFISLFGTRVLLDKLGEKVCLILIPVLNMILVLYLLLSYTKYSFIIVSVIIKSVNYALGYPLRENLYIPTLKEVKFKSKSWIDTFGTKFAKSTGSVFNEIVRNLRASLFFPAHLIFFTLIAAVWSVSAWLLGKRFEKAVSENEVIGLK